MICNQSKSKTNLPKHRGKGICSTDTETHTCKIETKKVKRKSS